MERKKPLDMDSCVPLINNCLTDAASNMGSPITTLIESDCSHSNTNGDRGCISDSDGYECRHLAAPNTHMDAYTNQRTNRYTDTHPTAPIRVEG